MSNFSSILLASDIDGTLALNGEVSKENIDAIRQFQNDGGLFTVATGRHSKYYMETFSDKVIPNECMLCLNGNLIYDTNAQKSIKTFKTNKASAEEIILDALKTLDGKIIKINLFDENEGYLFDGSVPTDLCKWVFVLKEEKDALNLRDYLRNKYSPEFNVERSWPTGVEVYNSIGGKGNALKYLKDVINPNIKTIISAGDYENDVTMLKIADIGYAIKGGSKEAYDAADRITDVTCNENAIAWIINELYKKGGI